MNRNIFEEIISRNELLQRVDFKKFVYFRFGEDEYVLMEIKTPANEMPCTFEVMYNCRALAGFRTHEMHIDDIVSILNCYHDADEFSVVNLNKKEQSDCPRTEPTDCDTTECNPEPNPEPENGPEEQEESAPSCNFSSNDAEDNPEGSIDVAEALIVATMEAWDDLKRQEEYCKFIGNDCQENQHYRDLRNRWFGLIKLLRKVNMYERYLHESYNARMEKEGK